MEILSIDYGSYSLKLIHSQSERGNLVHQSVREIVLDKIKADETMPEEERPLAVIRQLTKNTDKNTRIIYQVPNELVTARFLNLPAKSKKQAELMLPHQLEDDVPFGSGGYHSSASYYKRGNSIDILAAIVSSEKFQHFFELGEKHLALPSILTAEISLFQEHALRHPQKDPYIILDLGHKTTKAYFIKDSRIVSYHTSHIAGELINQVISKTYNIGLNETITFKHQNAFFLTENQFEKVDDDQKEFALFMQKAFNPLVQDIKRWNLGFRVTHGASINHMYICGGTSNIKNIDNFLAQETHIHVENYDPYELINFGEIEFNPIQKRSFAICHLMADNVSNKTNPLSFMTGLYGRSAYEDLPLHSTAFTGFRIAVVSLILAFSFVLEYFHLRKVDDQVEKKLHSFLNNGDGKTLKLSNTLTTKRNLSRKPEAILKEVARLKEEIVDEISTLRSSAAKNALEPLATLSNGISLQEPKDGEMPEVYMSFFSSSEDGSAEATFISSNKDYASLREKINNLNLKNLNIDESPEGLNINFEF